MKFSVLPTVLQDIVMLFCYNMPVHMVRANVNELLSIKSMGLPFFLYREKVWSWKFTRFLPNPINVFLPIEDYGGYYGCIIDDDAMYYLLLCLDFRRKNVKMFGSRSDWHKRFSNNWRTVGPFAAYYKMLLRSEKPVLKPNSPLLSYISASTAPPATTGRGGPSSGSSGMRGPRPPA